MYGIICERPVLFGTEWLLREVISSKDDAFLSCDDWNSEVTQHPEQLEGYSYYVVNLDSLCLDSNYGLKIEEMKVWKGINNEDAEPLDVMSMNTDQIRGCKIYPVPKKCKLTVKTFKEKYLK